MASVQLRMGLSPWLLLLSLPPAQAADPVSAPAAILGHFVGVGHVDPAWRPLAAGMPLSLGDEIVLRSGKLSLKLSDGTLLKLAGPAQLRLQPPDAAGRTTLELRRGRLFVRTQQRPGGEVRVHTPCAILAVLGPGAGVDASPGGSRCWCDYGTAYVEGGGAWALLPEGSEVTACPGEAPPAAVPMSEGTRRLNEELNLAAALTQTPGPAGTAVSRRPASAVRAAWLTLAPPPTLSVDAITRQRLAAAERVVRSLYEAYEREDFLAVQSLLAADFSTNDESGSSRNLSSIEESFRHDFANLDSIRVLRQPGPSMSFHRESDQVSLRERWIMNAVLAGGARLQQGGETVFTVGPDPNGGGLRVLRWEGDSPMARYHPTREDARITSTTVITPAAAGAPDIEVTRGFLDAGGVALAQADARFSARGISLKASAVRIEREGLLSAANVVFGLLGAPARAETLDLRPDGDLAAANASFVVNGAQVSAGSLTLSSPTQLAATEVRLTLGRIQVQAERLDVSDAGGAGATVGLSDADVAGAAGSSVRLVEATLQPPPAGSTQAFLTGTTSTGQVVSTISGQIVVEDAAGASLRAGRGEKLLEGEGFRFTTGTVTRGPADLFYAAGRLLAPGLRVLGAIPFDGVTHAPAEGYRSQVTAGELLAGSVLAVQCENGRHAKILVRAAATPSQLVFDWVYSEQDGSALSRAQRWPSRAKVAYDARLYSRTASGRTLLGRGLEQITEMRMSTHRLLRNGASMEAHLTPRLTTDRQVDDDLINLDRLGFRYFQPDRLELGLGDLSAEFTPYSLTQSLLGLVGWRNFAIGPAGTARLTAAIGPRWRPGSGFKFDGWVTGVRLASQQLRTLGPRLEDMEVGVNLVRSSRGKRSLGTYESGTVISIDATARLTNGVGLLGEWALSRSEEDGRILKGEAFLLRGTYRLGRLRVVLDRERVGAGFRSLSGSAASDQERTNAWVRYQPNDWLGVGLSFLGTRDNLDGSQPFTTRLSAPRGDVSINPFYPLLKGGFLRHLTIDLLVGSRRRASSDLPRSIDDRRNTLSLELAQRLGDFQLALGQDLERGLNRSARGTSRRGRATDISLRWRPRPGALPFAISPSIGLRRGRDEYTDRFGSLTSRSRSARFGVDMGDERVIAVGLGYEVSGSARTDSGGQNRRVLDLDLTRALDREGARSAALTYHLLNGRQESGIRRYTEGQLTGSFRQRF